MCNRTTTDLTTSIAAAIAGFLHLGEGSRVVEVAVRAVCLALPYLNDSSSGHLSEITCLFAHKLESLDI